MLLLVLLMLNVSVLFGCNSSEEQWNQFKIKHNKIYSSVEEGVRKEIFLSNLRIIEDHNAKAQRGFYSYTLGVNRFADWTNREFKLWLQPEFTRRQSPNVNAHQDVSDLPDSVDWRTSGIVPPVWDQGQCGNSLARVVLETLEELQTKQFKTSQKLSYQQIIECCTNCTECSGGFMDQCLVDMSGIESATDYPETQECQKCHFDPSRIALKVTGYVSNPPGDENTLKATLANVGPVATGIDASSFSFQLYSGGVYNDPSCSSTLLDHIVSIVGYGVETNKDFWLVKNSWGISWGEDGYIKMSRNMNNQCGIATDTGHPTVAKP